MANDAYPIAILASFAVHHYFPIIRDVAMQSKIVWVRILNDLNIFMITLFWNYQISTIPNHIHSCFCTVITKHHV